MNYTLRMVKFRKPSLKLSDEERRERRDKRTRGRDGFIPSVIINTANRLFDYTFALRASGMLRVTMFII